MYYEVPQRDFHIKSITPIASENEITSFPLKATILKIKCQNRLKHFPISGASYQQLTSSQSYKIINSTQASQVTVLTVKKKYFSFNHGEESPN